MNTTLTRDTRHQPSTVQTTASRPSRPLGVFDRLALHLGVALIRWGRRPGRELARHERLANSAELEVLHREQQRAALVRELEQAQANSNLLARIR